MKKLIIALDGPAGAGKSTVAQILAQKLNYNYIDTGAMFRAVSWKILNLNLTDIESIIKVASDIKIKLSYLNGKTKVFVNNEEITDQIRTPEVSRLVPEIAQISKVRDIMLQLQRQMAKDGGVVMDGRDIGTHVLPNADVKIFLTASIEERAQRRWRELVQKGFTVDFEEIKADIAMRDKKDSERDIAPLIQAADAILVDTTNLSITDAANYILEICKERRPIIV